MKRMSIEEALSEVRAMSYTDYSGNVYSGEAFALSQAKSIATQFGYEDRVVELYYALNKVWYDKRYIRHKFGVLIDDSFFVLLALDYLESVSEEGCSSDK